MNEAGVRAASSATRDAAGWMRCWSASKSSPVAVGRTISPSTTHRSGSSVRNAATSSGKYRVIGRSFRLPTSISSPSRKMIDRKPSHFGSYDPSAGMLGTSFASIGATGGMTGSFMRSFLPRAGLRAASSGESVPPVAGRKAASRA